MLVVRINEGQFVQIGEDIRVFFTARHSCSAIKLGIEAPKEVNIIRSTVLMRDMIQYGTKIQDKLEIDLAQNGGTINEQ